MPPMRISAGDIASRRKRAGISIDIDRYESAVPIDSIPYYWKRCGRCALRGYAGKEHGISALGR